MKNLITYCIIFSVNLIFTTSFKKDILFNSSDDRINDLDSNSYTINKFKDKFWTKENLRTTKSNDGKPIKYFFPNNNSANIKNYGLLYDFETACEVCPKGWHLPTAQEWNELIEFVGKKSGNELKDSLYWKNQVHKFTNKSGFSVRPSGYGNSGDFDNYFGTRAVFWSATRVDTHFVWGFVLADNLDTIRQAPQHPIYAFSVRCVKD